MILVDPIARCMKTRTWRHREACHLFCDGDLEELHAFALLLGLRLMWFQAKADLPHYDLTRSKRDLAVSLGAVEVDRKTTGEWIRRWRERRRAERTSLTLLTSLTATAAAAAPAGHEPRVTGDGS